MVLVPALSEPVLLDWRLLEPIYMPIKQEANGQSAEAIIVDNKQKAEADLQDVKLVEAEKKD